ncbi:competence/damage-inducible protein A [Haladaptatus sp. CMSO5]|uniref:competence/damage-inducible protein A n=1 Tax=Haladaptatus sp. CMSO5 TaxID=3120514 RepID=UPI002FCE41F5
MRVALVSVGDEILAGDTVNTNATWLSQQLNARGATVERVTVVPDRIADIAHVVNEYHAEYDAVIVTGGLGPTHDDLTMEGIGAAFGRAVERHEEALAWLTTHGGYSHDDLATGTAHLPVGARMLPNEVGVAPGCVVDAVYVFPGVPAEMKGMFDLVADEFSGVKRYTDEVIAAEPESALIDRMNEVQEKFGVKVGSYPGENVRIKLESEDEDAVSAAKAWLQERVTEAYR